MSIERCAMLLTERFGVDISVYLQTDLERQYQSEAQQVFGFGWVSGI